MELVKVISKASFVSHVVGSVSRKQELNVTKEYADFLVESNLAEYPKGVEVIKKDEPVEQSEKVEAGEPVKTGKKAK